MASILDRYGIKEVADVTFYEIDKETGKPGKPVLYLDTLKVSTIEQTAENTSARGGKGNPELISWDYNKEVSVTLEDALFSPKSMAIMFGDETLTKLGKTGSIRKTFDAKKVYEKDGAKYVKFADKELAVASMQGFDEDGAETDGGTGSKPVAYYVCELSTNDGFKIEITPDTFPGNYYVTGDTYARSEVSGEDDFFQFIMPKVKILSENTLTMEAEGDPTVFNMNLKVLKPLSGGMMELIQYTLADNTTPKKPEMPGDEEA